MHCEQGLDTYAGDGNGTNPGWETAMQVGHVKGVSLQATYGTVPSSTFQTWRTQLRALGIPVVGYGFLRFGAGQASPTSQAKALLHEIGAPNVREMPPVLDLEMNGKRPSGMSADDVKGQFVEALEVMHTELGVYPGIYTGNVVMIDPEQMDNPSIPELVDAWLWVKHWPYPVGSPAIYDPSLVDKISQPAVPPQFDGQYLWHQYQGDATHFPGLIGKCDTWRSPVVELGDTGGTVRWIQKRAGVAVDGSFGVHTHDAVMAFQAKHSLIADGRVGLYTKAALAWVRV